MAASFVNVPLTVSHLTTDGYDRTILVTLEGHRIPIASVDKHELVRGCKVIVHDTGLAFHYRVQVIHEDRYHQGGDKSPGTCAVCSYRIPDGYGYYSRGTQVFHSGCIRLSK